jgi:hypothetical protein
MTCGLYRLIWVVNFLARVSLVTKGGVNLLAAQLREPLLSNHLKANKTAWALRPRAEREICLRAFSFPPRVGVYVNVRNLGHLF